MAQDEKALDPAGKRIRAGILGAGFISDYHIRPLTRLANVELSGVCDPDRGKAIACQARWKVLHAFQSLPEMLQSGTVDVVHVLTPPPTHAEAAIACLEAGCHVFVEKPLAVSEMECRQVGLCAHRRQRSVGVNLNAAYFPVFRRLVDAIESWRLGAVQHVTACVNVPLRQLSAGQHDHWMFREFGNIILELAPHPLSQIQQLLGPVVDCSVLVSGAVRLRSGSVFYDTWQIALVCQRGTAQLLLSVGREFLVNTLHVIGQDGSAFLDLRRNTIGWSEKSRFVDPVDNLRDAVLSASNLARQGLANFGDYGAAFLKLKPASDPFSFSIAASIRHFYEALEQGKEPRMGLEAGTGIIGACERIIQAAGHYLQLNRDKAFNHATLS
jgi:predicted dehydrogenase